MVTSLDQVFSLQSRFSTTSCSIYLYMCTYISLMLTRHFSIKSGIVEIFKHKEPVSITVYRWVTDSIQSVSYTVHELSLTNCVYITFPSPVPLLDIIRLTIYIYI